MIEKLRALLLIIAAVIHLLPLAGLLGPAKLEQLYGISVGDPNLQILMQHRAVLFGLLGALLLAAAFRPDWQMLAIVAGLVSAVSFLAIAWSIGGYNPELARVVVADLIAVASLLIAAGLHLAFPES